MLLEERLFLTGKAGPGAVKVERLLSSRNAPCVRQELHPKLIMCGLWLPPRSVGGNSLCLARLMGQI